MPIEEIATRALAQRRLVRAPLLQGIEDIRALERMSKTLTDAAARTALDELILERKRDVRGELEGLEKESESYDKASLPLAAFFIGLASWLTVRQIVPPGHVVAVEAVCSACGAVIWLGCRYQSLRLGKKARHALARLGKVE
jgi:hypothetical protein